MNCTFVALFIDKFCDVLLIIVLSHFHLEELNQDAEKEGK